MGSASALSLASAIVALCAGAFNGWLFMLRRKEPEHLYLAIAAVGIAGMGGSMALLYQAQDLATAQRWQGAMLVAGGPLIAAFVRFTSCLLRFEQPRLEAAALVLAAASVVLPFFPGLLFTDRVIQRESPELGLHYVAGAFAPVAFLYMLGIVALFGRLIQTFWLRRRRLGDDASLLLVALCLWFVSGFNDILIGLEVYQAPFLTSVGYGGFLLGFTAILMRRMAGSMTAVERNAAQLQELVERRTEELREKDLQLAHGEQMASIGTLAASVAHEINNPIAFVASNLNRVDELIEKPEEREELEEILAECREGIDRVRVIVSALLSFARRSEGRDERVDLREVVESVLPMVRREARFRAQLVTEFEPVPAVVGDPRMLGQVVLNLVLNGLQAIPEGHAASNRVTIQVCSTGDQVELRIHDTGPGIPAEIRPRIFDPFFTTKAAGTGTGLGLAVTRQLVVERHRGRIEIDCPTDRGTIVTVSLPACPHEATAGLADRAPTEV